MEGSISAFLFRCSILVDFRDCCTPVSEGRILPYNVGKPYNILACTAQGNKSSLFMQSPTLEQLHTLSPLVAALSTSCLSVNCFDLFVYFIVRNFRICNSKLTLRLKHYTNIDLTFSVTVNISTLYICMSYHTGKT